jgi:ribosome biogenesis protein Nip4
MFVNLRLHVHVLHGRQVHLREVFDRSVTVVSVVARQVLRMVSELLGPRVATRLGT